MIVIIAAALVILHGFLKDYESGRPANTMDTLVAHIEKGNVGEWIKKSGLLGEFETESIVSDYFRDAFEGKQISYKKKAGEYSESTPVYVLYADDDKIAGKMHISSQNGRFLPSTLMLMHRTRAMRLKLQYQREVM